MKKLKLIYNPHSGDKTLKSDLDICIERFQNADYEVSLLRCENKNDIAKHLDEVDKYFYDTFVICGGDGTINIFINYIMNNNFSHIPIGIIPSGTANDFATFLKLPKDPAMCCDVIANNNISMADIGLCNGNYFINVCACGLFANVGETIDKNFKDALGKFGYYIKAIEQMSSFKPIEFKITTSTEVIQDKFDLFLILNGSSTGGIDKISPNASINDGMFDFVGFKDIGISNIASLAIQFLKGDYLSHDKILFFRDNNICVEAISNPEVTCDLDGEGGPLLPIKVVNIKNAIKIFTIK